jgi:L-amino acid N-acyltransferase YncA
MIRPATPADADAIGAIYNPYVTGTVITFEETPVAAAEMAARIATLTGTHPWLVHEDAGQIQGYAYAGPWRTRAAYRHAVETTVYLDAAQSGRGLGSALYDALLAQLRHRGFHCAMGGIALPNPASVALHEKMGFRKVAHFSEVGWKQNRWIDVGYWQCLL